MVGVPRYPANSEGRNRLEEARDGCQRRQGKGHSAPAGTRTQAHGAIPAPSPASDHPFGPDGAAILATEH
jgi:hypothetical protein